MTAQGFIPPGGVHDSTCQYLCRNVRPECEHACSVCDDKKVREARELPCIWGGCDGTRLTKDGPCNRCRARRP